MKIIKIEPLDKNMQNNVKIEWHLGLFCNNNCSYCTDANHNDIPKHLSFEKFKIGINNLLNNFKPEQLHIEITGGEPTLNPKFLDMLKYMNFKNIKNISFTTNGCMSLEYYKKALEYSKITISYHMEYNNISIEDIIKLGKNNKRLKIHIMFLPGTLERTKNIIEILSKNTVKYIIRRIRPSYYKDHIANEYWSDGRLKSGIIVKPFDTSCISVLLQTENSGTDHSESNQKYYSEEELKFLENVPKATYNDCLIYYSDGSIKELNRNDITANKLNQFKGWVCYAGVEMLRIGENGELTVGKCEQPSLGNIFGKFKIPKEPCVCNNDWCCSITNIHTTKFIKGI